MARITITQATLTGLELLFSIITFVLFCSAYPDQYRTRLWEIGGENGWNSNPRLRIYFYANYEEPPRDSICMEPKFDGLGSGHRHSVPRVMHHENRPEFLHLHDARPRPLLRHGAGYKLVLQRQRPVLGRLQRPRTHQRSTVVS
ncbi:hypothetical protein PG987_005146 [Apiospora arundinis]